MKTRSYPIVCPSCGGSGWINNPNPISTAATTTIVCPACNGTKTIMVNETDFAKEIIKDNTDQWGQVDYDGIAETVIKLLEKKWTRKGIQGS